MSGDFLDDNDQVLPSGPGCGTAADLDPAATLAVGNLDYDAANLPEIVVFGEESNSDGFSNEAGRIHIFDNAGRRIYRSPLYSFDSTSSSAENPGVSLANVIPSANAADELVEIIIGRDVFILGEGVDGLEITGRLTGTNPTGVSTADAIGVNDQGPVNCVADLIEARPGLEIIAGSTVYGVPLDGSGNLDPSGGTLTPLGTAGRNGFCAIADVWGATAGDAPGPANVLDGEPELVLIEGGDLYIYAIGVTPPANPGDDYQVTFNQRGAARNMPGSGNGGAPNVDDFDGDGFPEVGTAAAAGYVVFDLQDPVAGSCPAWTSFQDNQASNPRSPSPGVTSCTSDADCNPGAGGVADYDFACNEAGNSGAGECICLHNGWQRITQDGSSAVTGSSVFDFNGDGAAEVVYNDECHFRVYEGLGGEELFLEPSEGRTRIEYPIVADVDNDGNAEIIFASSNESSFCTNTSQSANCSTNPADGNFEELVCPSFGEPFGQSCVGSDCSIVPPAGSGISNIRDVFNNGIEVWGDPSDRWVSARRVWNQYSYHVTNISESGVVPRFEPNSWQPLGSRFYNTYRSQPRSFGVAPDLTVDLIQLSSPDAACGQLSTTLTISVQISNVGDLRVGAGVPVAFLGTFNGAEELLLDTNMTDPLVFTLTDNIEPRGQFVFQVSYAAANNGQAALPSDVRVIVDPPSTVFDPGDTSQPDGLARECME
ncbi:MAG: VCBS repeat-containing protein, partial [Myxococcota bacterium]